MNLLASLLQDGIRPHRSNTASRLLSRSSVNRSNLPPLVPRYNIAPSQSVLARIQKDLRYGEDSRDCMNGIDCSN